MEKRPSSALSTLCSGWAARSWQGNANPGIYYFKLLAGLTGLHGNVAAADEEFAGHMERKKRQIRREWSRACVVHMLAICSNNKEKTGEHTCIHALIKHMQFTHTQTHSSALITFELISFSSQREENESLPHPCWGTKSRGLVGLG